MIPTIMETITTNEYLNPNVGINKLTWQRERMKEEGKSPRRAKGRNE